MATEDETLQAANEESLQLIDDDPITFAALAVLGALVILALGQIEFAYPAPPIFPVSEVPINLGTVGLFLVALALGPVWGTLAYAISLSGFLVDIPVLSPESPGLDTLIGAPGGFFIVGLAVVPIIGWILHRGVYPKRLDNVSIPLQVGALALGVLLIRPVGAAWLGIMSDQIGVGASVNLFGLWYLPAQGIKALLALVIATGGTYVVVRYVEDED